MYCFKVKKSNQIIRIVKPNKTERKIKTTLLPSFIDSNSDSFSRHPFPRKYLPTKPYGDMRGKVYRYMADDSVRNVWTRSSVKACGMHTNVVYISVAIICLYTQDVKLR